MDPKSRDSKGRDLPLLPGQPSHGTPSRRTLGAAVLLVLASFGAACDAGSESVDPGDTDAAEGAAEARDAAGPRPGATRALAGQRVARATTDRRLTASAFDEGTFAQDPPETIDAAPETIDDQPETVDDELEDDEAKDDAPSCADTDTTAPGAVGRVVVLGADEIGMTPISPTDCVEVVDDCDASPLVELLWATSDEPETGVAADDRSPDVNDLGCGIGVRAERAENGDGRVYTVGFRATDTAGNATEGLCTILVESQPGVSVDSGMSFERDLRGYGCE